MKKFKTVLSMAAAIMIAMSGAAYAAVTNNSPAPDFTLTDSNGNSHSLSDFAGKYVVLEWVNYDCPFVKKFYRFGDMQGLQEDLTGQDVIWLSINSSATGKQGAYGPDEVNQIMANSEAQPTAYLFDTDGTVGRLYGAKTTPHMYVINPDGDLIYQGAIDSIASVDSSDIAEADNYVLQALSQASAGDAITDPVTKPYGCSVKY